MLAFSLNINIITSRTITGYPKCIILLKPADIYNNDLDKKKNSKSKTCNAKY
nr:hypothetical protein [Brachyspira hampsonii]